MAKSGPTTMTAGGAIFPRLKALGVDYVFANSGTDFPPIIEGLAQAVEAGTPLPKALVIPHEHAAMSMAHGYYLVTGRPQAVMLHTNVGLANGVIGAINAACEGVPILLMSGRTPVTEGGRFGARTVPIGWGQEMRDQTAMVRECVKWDYELKFPEQIAPMLDRAYAIATSTPKGPVYLSLPREVLCEDIDASQLEQLPSIQAHTGAPNPDDIAAAAALVAKAERPVIIAQRGTGTPETFAAFGRWVEDWGIAVSSWWAEHLAIPTDHPCHVGPDPGPWLADADVIVVLDCLAPWWPDRHPPHPGARIIAIGPDPIFARFPGRTFRSDITISGETDLTLPALMSAMNTCPRDEDATAIRRARLNAAAARQRAAMAKDASARNPAGISKAWVSKCLGDALHDRDATVFSELGATLGHLERAGHGSWFDAPHSGGLGFGFPAALGAKLADPERLIVTTMGDGSYMFANPTVCHQIAEALDLAVLVIVLNNEEWGAVRKSVELSYPDGAAARSNRMPLTALSPAPDFCRTASASRAWSRRVTEADHVADAIRDALAVVETENRLALLDIATLPD